MKIIGVILIFIHFMSPTFCQERLTEIRSGLDPCKMLIINQDNQERILTVYPNGEYDVRRIFSDGSDSLCYKGKAEFNIRDMDRVHYHSGHLIYSDNKYLHICNMTKVLTYSLKSPEAYAFGKLRAGLIDTNSIFINLTETRWDIQAKMYHVDFEANFIKIETKLCFKSRNKDYVLLDTHEGELSYYIYDIKQDTIKDFNINPTRNLDYILEEEGIYTIEDNIFKITDYENLKSEIILELPIDLPGYVSIIKLGDTTVVNNSNYIGQQFIVLDKNRRSIIFDSIYTEKYKVRFKALEGEHLVLSVKLTNGFEGFRLINLNSLKEIIIQCKCDSWTNVQKIGSDFYFYGETGLSKINISAKKNELLVIDEKYRGIDNAIRFDDGNIMFNLLSNAYNISSKLAVYRPLESSLNKIEPLKSAEVGITQKAEIYPYNALVFINNNDIYSLVNGRIFKLNSADKSYKPNSLKYFAEIDKTYAILEDQLSFTVLEIKPNGVTTALTFNKLVDFDDYLYFEGHLIFYNKFRTYSHKLGGLSLVYREKGFNFPTSVNNVILDYKNNLLLYDNLDFEPKEYDWLGLPFGVGYQDGVVINDKSVRVFKNGELSDIPANFDREIFTSFRFITKIENDLLYIVSKAGEDGIVRYTGDSLIYEGILRPIYTTLPIEGNLILTAYGDYSYVYDNRKKKMYDLSSKFGVQNFHNLIIHRSDTIIITSDKGNRHNIRFTKLSDEFTNLSLYYELKDESLSSSFYLMDYGDQKIIKSGCHLYIWDESIVEIASNLNPLQISSPFIEDNIIYYIGWDPELGNQLYKYSLNPDKIIDVNLPIVDRDTTTAELVLYPNPASDEIRLKTNKFDNNIFDFKIWDSTGKLLIKNESQKTESPIDISNLSMGIYYIQCTSNNTSVSIPFYKANL